MTFSGLEIFLSILGAVGFMTSLVVILLGKKVGDPGDQKFHLGNSIDLQLNTVVALVVLTIALAAGPYVLTVIKINPDNYVLKSELANYIPRDSVAHNFIPKNDWSIIINGGVVDEHDKAANDVSIVVVRSQDGGEDTIKSSKSYMYEQGIFEIPLKNLRPQDAYSIAWTKAGYIPKRLKLSFENKQITIPIVLSKGVVN